MSFPTPHRKVNATLEALLGGVRETLGERFVGLYLYGSLAAGDFQPDRSDIDFVVVTAGSLPHPMVEALREMHKALWAEGSYWTQKLEGAYIPKAELRRHSPTYPPRPMVNEGHFYLAGEDADWVFHRHVLREHETIVAGPSIRNFIDPVGPEDLREAVRALLKGWWQPMLINPKRLYDTGYAPYAVLSLCRALYTLEHGAIVSKTQATRWALGALDGRWKGLIRRAEAWREGRSWNGIDEVLQFLAYVLEQDKA